MKQFYNYSLLLVLLFASMMHSQAQVLGSGNPLLFTSNFSVNPNGLGPHVTVPAPFEGTGYTGSWALWDGPAQGETIVPSSTGIITDVNAQVAIRFSAGDIQCKIYDAPNGNLLATSTNSISAPWDGNEFNFVLGTWYFSSFNLIAGTHYYFEFSATNNNRFFIGMQPGYAYAGGQHYTGVHGSVVTTGYDIDMRINYGSEIPSDLLSNIDQADIDNDGDMDFVRTSWRSQVGGIDFFLNDGSNYFNVTSINPYGISSNPLPSGLSHVCPDLADFDGDGDLDLMVVPFGGSGFYYFRNNGTASSPNFTTLLTNPFSLTGNIKSIDVVDLDGDGLLDIIGNNDQGSNAQWAFYHNIGTASTPVYAAPVMNPYGLDFNTSQIYYDLPAYPTFTDWDDDGDLDLIYWSQVAMYYQENIGSVESPSFASSIQQFNYYSYFGNVEPVNWDGDPAKELLWTTEAGNFQLLDAPTFSIESQPVDVSVCEGSYTYFAISAAYASGYQWQKYDSNLGWINASDNFPYAGATTALYEFYNANDNDVYRCAVTDFAGTVHYSNQVSITTSAYTTYYFDNDGDGYGDYTIEEYTCFQPDDYVTNGDDCDDNDETILGPPGDPSVFPDGVWNVYGFNGTDTDSYRGYYTFSGLTYHTDLDYPDWASPSFAPGWQGCDVTDDNHSVIFRRHGFPESSFPYILQLNGWDDDVYVYVNGEPVYSNGCCGGDIDVWTGELGANDEIEIRYVEYGGGSYLGFSLNEYAPLMMTTNYPDVQTEACSNFSVMPVVTSNAGYNINDITFTATVDNATIVNPTVDNVDTWNDVFVYFNGAGTIGNTVLHLTATDPSGNTATVDFNITTTACNTIWDSNGSDLYCGDTTGTVSFFFYNYPDAINYIADTVYASNTNAYQNTDIQFVEAIPSTYVNYAGIEFQGYEYVYQYSFTGTDDWGDVVVLFLDTAGTIYNAEASTYRNFDYDAPQMNSNFGTITLPADTTTCGAIATWDVQNTLPNNSFGNNSHYISNFTDAGIFYVAANAGLGVNYFGLNGNAGADGNGEVYIGDEYYTAASGRSYRIFWETAQELSNDPGVNNILIVDASETAAWLDADFSESDNLAILRDLSGNETALFAATIGSNYRGANGGNSTFYSEETMLLMGERFADAIDALRTTATGNPFDLSQMDAAMQTETDYLVNNVLDNFYGLDPYNNNDLQYNGNNEAIGVSDGGHDMYDGANYITTNFNDYYYNYDNGIPYTEGQVMLGGPIGDSFPNTISISDECTYTYSFNYPSGTTFPIGTTTVTLTAQDNSGNVGYYYFDVVVEGTTYEYYVDADNDGFGAGSLVTLCTIPTSGYALIDGDCDDANANINPDADEICNGIDDDCDGDIDNDLTFTTYYTDADGDTYGVGTGTSLCSNPGAGYATNNTDCDDGDAAIHPGATEVCNNIDDDCDEQIDNGLTFITYYTDADGDTYGVGTGTSLCSNPGAGYATNNTDCDDGNAAIHPGATEVCNNFDDNCDAQIDNGLTFVTYYADADGDNYGAGTGVTLCYNPGAAYATNNTDCDDANAFVNAGAAEVCNDIDDDCNSVIDDGLNFQTWFNDTDGDNYGTGNGVFTCADLSNGYSLNNGDCDDGNALVNAGATEVCNDIDDDCNGATDDGLTFNTYFVDADNDAFGAGNGTSACYNLGAGFTLVDGDCDDANADVNPNATEIAGNNIDDNCDGSVDNGVVEMDALDFVIFPNPTNGNEVMFTANAAYLNLVHIRIYDNVGKIIFTNREVITPGAIVRVEFNQVLASGIYFMELATDKQMTTKKFVVEN